MQLADPDTLEAGQLLSGQGRTRYIDNNLWRNLRDEDIHGLSDHEEEDDDQDFAGLNGTQPVSYTHLTLPTIYSV